MPHSHLVLLVEPQLHNTKSSNCQFRSTHLDICHCLKAICFYICFVFNTGGLITPGAEHTLNSKVTICRHFPQYGDGLSVWHHAYTETAYIQVSSCFPATHGMLCIWTRCRFYEPLWQVFKLFSSASAITKRECLLRHEDKVIDLNRTSYTSSAIHKAQEYR